MSSRNLQNSLKSYLLLFIASLLISTSCNQKAKKGSINEQDKKEVLVDSLPQKSVDPNKLCYTYRSGENSISLKADRNGDMISGKLQYNFFEKDANKGTIDGFIKEDTIFAVYYFMSEGIESKRDVLFLFTKDGLIEGFGPVNEATGLPDFSVTRSINFNHSMVLKSTDCDLSAQGCKVKNGEVYSTLENSCINPSSETIILKDLTGNSGAKPTYLLMGKDQLVAEIFLPDTEAGLVLTAEGDEGNRTWNYGKYKLISWKGYVLQLDGVNVYGGS